MVKSGHIFNLSILLLGLSLPLFYLKGKAGAVIAGITFWSAVVLGLAYIAWRYWAAWPMTPMYLGTVALPPVLAAAAWLSSRSAPETQRLFVLRRAICLCFLVGAASALFPKDFYLPFLKTTSVFSHLHLLFTVLGKAALLLAGLWAWSGLHDADRLSQNSKETTLRENNCDAHTARLSSRETTSSAYKFQSWLIWGFALWTLCMFAGEIWSYQGWGIPVVWDDAVIVCFMATWFYYIGLLHLHLTRSWSTRNRRLAAVLGIGLILALNCYPDLGPYRPLVK